MKFTAIVAACAVGSALACISPCHWEELNVEVGRAGRYITGSTRYASEYFRLRTWCPSAAASSLTYATDTVEEISVSLAKIARSLGGQSLHGCCGVQAISGRTQACHSGCNEFAVMQGYRKLACTFAEIERVWRAYRQGSCTCGGCAAMHRKLVCSMWEASAEAARIAANLKQCSCYRK